MMKTKVLQCMAIFVMLILVALPTTLATKVGNYPGGCYRSGGFWYCARYDNASFLSTCAGTVPAPHLNLEVYKGTSDKLTSMVLNYHVGWKTYISKTTGKTAQCLVTYESKTRKCDKICYDKKVGQAGDVLKKINYPDSMKYDYDVSKEFKKLYINNGTSSYLQTISTGAGVFLVAAATYTAVAAITVILIASVGR